MATTKISITIEDAALRWLRERANGVHGGNLSAAIAEATDIARRQEALGAFLDAEQVPPLDPSELEAFVREWQRSAPPSPTDELQR